jgi:hypothetical protein
MSFSNPGYDGRPARPGDVWQRLRIGLMIFFTSDRTLASHPPRLRSGSLSSGMQIFPTRVANL